MERIVKITTRTALGLAGLAVALPAQAADMTIADFAPENAMIVLGSNDMSAAKAAFDRTGFKSIWDDKALRSWLTDSAGKFMEQTKSDLEDMGIDLEKLMVVPSGALGAAWWLDTGEDGDEHIFLFADFGDDADGLEEQILEMLENAEDAGDFEVDQTEFGDTTIHTIESIENEDDEAPEDWEAEWDEENWDDSQWLGGGEEIHFARMGNTLFISSDIGQIERTLETIEDEAFGEGLAESELYQEAIASVGDPHVFVSVMAGEFLGEMAGELGPFGPLVSQLGVDSIRSASMGVRFDTDDAMAESMFSVIMPEKKGLIALLDNPPMRVSPPAFVGADASTFSAFQFDFTRLIPTIERSLDALPANEAGQVAMIFEQMKMMLGPLFASMGPEIYMVSNIDKPFAADSQKNIVMIRTKDEGAVNRTLQSTGAMIGLGSRDFLGNTIWSSPPGGFVELPAIGVGGGFLYIGDETGVENAIRAVAQGGAGGLAEEDAFKHATQSLGNGVISYGFTSTSKTLAFTEWSFKNMKAMIEAQINAMPGMEDLDPQFKEDILAEALAEVPEFMQNAPSLDSVVKNMGDGAFEIRSTDNGFVGRWLVLRPE